MQRSFTIKPYYNAMRGHNYFPQNNYPQTHPYLYHASDAQGWDVYILSRRGDYKSGQRIAMDCTQINGSYFLDNSPALNAYFSPSARQPATPPGKVNSDVIVLINSAKPKNGLTEVSGEIFYVDPRLKDLTAPDLRSAFKDSAKIIVMTHIKENYLPVGQTHIFARLRDVTVTNQEIRATDDLMPQPKAP